MYTCEKNHFKQDHEKWCKNLKLYCQVIIESEKDIKTEAKDLNAFPSSMCALEINNGKRVEISHNDLLYPHWRE